ncbi:hypothetical protein FYB92_06435 [Novacetimonas sp. GS1]
MKLFLKSFRRRRLFEKRRHPKTVLIFYQCVVFKQSLRDVCKNSAKDRQFLKNCLKAYMVFPQVCSTGPMPQPVWRNG